MKKNIGTIDRTIRIFIAISIAVLYFTHTIHGIKGIVLLFFAGIFLATSFLNSCPLYIPFRLSTRKK